jgi:hypothetical protein
LYTIPTEELRAFGGIPGLAFLPLTRDGGHPEVVEEAIQEVQAQVTPDEQSNVLNILFWFASLAFDREEDQQWLTRRFNMLNEILSETPLAKHLKQQGLEQGFKESLYTVVSTRFPELFLLARKQTEHMTDTTALNLLLVQITIAQTAEDARQYLLSIE